MRLCRFDDAGTDRVAFYTEEQIIPLAAAAAACGVSLEDNGCLQPFLSCGSERATVQDLEQKCLALSDEDRAGISIATDSAQLLVPIPNPTKLMFLAGNYSKHIEEGGGRAEEQSKTFPYVFMKPALTTLTHPGNPVKIPAISPDHIDWELELGVIIGKQCKGVSAADALDYVAGYTVINDISDRQFKPNSDRNERDKDGFFDWLHGKWHDTFCPAGPCVVPADEQTDPQTMSLNLKVNGEVEQDGSTSEMIFPVTAIVEFISSFVTLEPGDIIATGTTAGVGAAKNKYLKPGDVLEAEIEGIGVLRNPVE